MTVFDKVLDVLARFVDTLLCSLFRVGFLHRRQWLPHWIIIGTGQLRLKSIICPLGIAASH